jgi:hypothetical protein
MCREGGAYLTRYDAEMAQTATWESANQHIECLQLPREGIWVECDSRTESKSAKIAKQISW